MSTFLHDSLRKRLARVVAAAGGLLCIAALAGCGQTAAIQQTSSQSSSDSTSTAAVAPTYEADLNGDTYSSTPRPQDDFYLSVNYGWLQETTVDPIQGQSATLIELDENVNARLVEITQRSIGKLDDGTASQDEAQIASLYTTAIDMDTRDAAGLGAAEPLFKSIENASTLEDLTQALGSISGKYGFATIAGGITSYQVAKRHGVYSAVVTDAPVVIGKSYYTSDDSSTRDLLKAYIAKMLEIYGYPSDKAEKEGAAVYDMMAQLGEKSLSMTESYDPDTTSTMYTWDELKALYSNVDVETFYTAAKASPEFGVSEYCVASIEEAKTANDLYVEDNLETLKAYSIFCLLECSDPYDDADTGSIAQYLGSDFRDAYQSFHGALNGASEQDTDENLAIAMGNNLLSTQYGKIYAQDYVSSTTKADITDMIGELIDIYRAKIKANTWMSESTKAGALAKLDNMGMKVAYPDVYDTIFDGVELVPASEGGVLIDNVLELDGAYHAHRLGRIGQQVDKNEWDLSVQTVNAYYEPSNNEIAVPAGILQEPFYSSEASHDSNLGGIGSVIGHELSHAFDNDGSKYDETGELNDWWTDEDHATYDKLTSSIASYYSRYEVVGAGFVDGEQTLPENIADLGGVSCFCEAIAQEHGIETSSSEGTPLGEASPDKVAAYKAGLQDAFNSYALIFRAKYTDAYRDYRMQTNVHSLGYIRVDGVLSSTDAFYVAYDVQEGDAMYVAPESRVGIW